MFRTLVFLVTISLIGLLVFGACVPRAAQPTSPSAEQVKGEVSTSVALTIDAYQSQTAAAASYTPTVTVTPTITLPPFPTLTPFTPPPTQALGGGPITPPAYDCDVVGKKPIDNTVFKVNASFDIKFWILNTGSKSWPKGPDLLYDSGTNLLTTDARYELPALDPGDQAGPFLFDAQAPGKPGTYLMKFKVQGEFCSPYILIIVKK